MDLDTMFYTFHPTYTQNDSLHSFFAYDSYVEQFWLPILGPTATHLINYLVFRSLRSKDSYSISKPYLAQSLGTGLRSGNSSPIQKQLLRLCRNNLIFQVESNEFLIPKVIPMLNNFHLNKLDEIIKSNHQAWISRLEISPLSTYRRRAKALVLKLQSMGVDSNAIISILNSTGLHPSVIAEAIELADQSNVA